jgi:flagellar biosynthetic protein FlhB
VREGAAVADEDKDSKTEDATPQKIEESRKKGQVAFSREVGAVVTVFGSAMAFISFGESLASGVIELTKNIYKRIAQPNAPLGDLALDTVLLVGVPLAAIMIFLGIALFLTSFAQVGALLAWEAVKPDIKKLNPLKKAKQMYFSVQGLADFAKALMKIGGLGLVGIIVLRNRWEILPGLVWMHPAIGLAKVGEIAIVLVFSIAALLVLIAAADVAYVRWKYARDLMMSLHDIKQETKGREGSPEVRGKRRQKQMEMSQQRLGVSVPTADVVVTNPTHFAVAIKYDHAGDGAPMVVAKGADKIAFNIRAIARENGVSVIENRYLARILYAKVKVGGEVPETLWTAVAQVLTQVAHIRQRMLRDKS